jgi:hypothetical protein
MTRPFEDPRKTKMREQAKAAIDAAGYTLEEEAEPLPLPGDTELNGALVGDLQSVDGDGNRYVYYLRPQTSRPMALPQWLGNLATATTRLDRVRLYVVVERSNDLLERSCRVYGAGLLRLKQTHFEHLIDPTEFDAATLKRQFLERVKRVRRRMETKMNVKIRQLEEHYAEIDDLTAKMPPKKRDEYIDDAETAIAQWQEWGEEMSADIDEVAVSGSDDALRAIEMRIKDGPS